MKHIRVPIASLVDQLCWVSYLLLLFILSFINDSYASPNWMLFTAAIYGFTAFYLMHVVISGRASYRALGAAKWAILLWLAVVSVHVLQLVLPIQTPIHTLFSTSAPAWYRPELPLSLVPHQTQWFLMREIMVLTVFCLALLLIRSRRRVRQLVLLFALVGMVHALIAILAKLGNVHLVSAQSIDGHFSPARGLFVNRNHLAAFVSLCLLGPLVLQLRWFIQKSHLHWRTLMMEQLLSRQVLAMATAVMLLLTLVLSQSRAGIFGFALSFSLVLIWFSRSHFQARQLFKVVLPVIVLGAVLLAYFGQEIVQKISADGLSIGERGVQWQITWQAIRDSWLVGYGVGSYTVVFQIYREYIELRQVTFDQAHNDFLHIWLEQGLLGLSVWLMFLFVVIRSAISSLHKTNSSLVTAVLLSALIVMFAALMQSFVDFNLQINNIRCYFFVIIALVFVVPRVSRGT